MKPGDEVVCIDGGNTAVNMPVMQEIITGHVYTVRWAGKFTDMFYDGTYDGLRLVEVKRGIDPVSGVDDKPFAARRFKLVQKVVEEKRIEEVV